jgi:predicted Zn-dependent protease
MVAKTLAALLGAALCAHCYTHDSFKPSPAQQVELGKRAAADLRKREKVLPESDAKVKLVRRIGKRLLATFHDDKPWEFSFDVIESKEVNAFALPGGPTFIYTGLLNKLKTEDELAGIMGHELTHVRKEHWAYGYRDSQQHRLGLTIILILARANNSVANLASITDETLFSLPFSRKHESEADDGGLIMMTQAGFNPQGMVDAFKLLQSLSGGKNPPEWLSDHPSDARRISTMQEKASAMKGPFPPQRLIGFNVASFL